jgi:hypothetical protein
LIALDGGLPGEPVAAGYDPFPGSLHINDSGIQLDMQKQSEMPPGIIEVDGYEEEGTADGQAYAVRQFLAPWSLSDQFMEWCLGVEWNSFHPSITGTFPLQLSGSVAQPPFAYGGGLPGAFAADGQPYGTIPGQGSISPGVLVRVPPAQHPVKPWLYCSACNLVKGESVWTSRDDVTVLPFNPATYGIWDTGLYDTPAQHPSVDLTAAVQAVLQQITTLSSQITQLTTFPLSAPPATLLAVFALLYPSQPPGIINVPNVEFSQWQDLIAATSQAQIQFYAQQTYPSNEGSPLPVPGVAVRYLIGVQNLQQQLQAARISLQAVRTEQAAILTAALPRVVVPMIQFQQPSPLTGGQPFGDGLARFRVTYKPRRYRVRSDLNMIVLQQTIPPNIGGGGPGTLTVTELQRFVERRRTWTVKSYTLPTQAGANGLQFVGTNPVAYVQTQGLLALEEWTYIWHNVPDVPALAIAACIGKINNAPFDFLNVNLPPSINQLHAPQTMLCMNPEVEEIEPNCRGRVRHKITYKFIKNPNGWNTFPQANGTFAPATFGGAAPDLVNATNLLYKFAPFDVLFTQPGPIAYNTPGIG